MKTVVALEIDYMIPSRSLHRHSGVCIAYSPLHPPRGRQSQYTFIDIDINPGITLSRGSDTYNGAC